MSVLAHLAGIPVEELLMLAPLGSVALTALLSRGFGRGRGRG